MIAQIITYAFIAAIFMSLLLLAWCVLKTKSETQKITNLRSYSYMRVLLFLIVAFSVSTIISGLLYIETGSLDHAVSIYAFLLGCIFVGTVKSLHYVSGAKKALEKRLSNQNIKAD